MKYKVIKSAAHNFGHSFVSLMNYGPDDYVMQYLADAALESGASELFVDLLSGEACPKELLLPPVRRSVARYVEWFPQLLRSQEIAPEAIRSARMRLRFFLDRVNRTTAWKYPGTVGLPFECRVVIEDDRGKVHEGVVRDVWVANLPEEPVRRQPITQRIRAVFRRLWSRLVREGGEESAGLADRLRVTGACWATSGANFG